MKIKSKKLTIKRILKKDTTAKYDVVQNPEDI